MIYIVVAACYALVSISEWPCHAPKAWRKRLHHNRYLVEVVLALSYLSQFIHHLAPGILA